MNLWEQKLWRTVGTGSVGTKIDERVLIWLVSRMATWGQKSIHYLVKPSVVTTVRSSPLLFSFLLFFSPLPFSSLLSLFLLSLLSPLPFSFLLSSSLLFFSLFFSFSPHTSSLYFPFSLFSFRFFSPLLSTPLISSSSPQSYIFPFLFLFSLTSVLSPLSSLLTPLSTLLM